MKVPLLDLKAQFARVEGEVREAIDGVLETQRFVMGPEVTSLEEEAATYVSCKYGVGVSSGSDALLISLMALGIGPGDEVITTPFTFFATVGAISRVGAKPVFLDIEPGSFNMDAKSLSKVITDQTKAMIPVHLFGQSADMTPMMEVCRENDIAMIEDAAQAIGTEYQKRRVGSLGQLGCFSFFPSKNLGALGDGGLVTTNDDSLFEKLRILRNHGSKPKYFHKFVGGNFRLDALQAAVVRVKLKCLDEWTKERQNNADRYDHLFGEADLGENLRVPWRRNGDRHIFNQYVIRVKERDALKAFLTEYEIGTEIYYPLPMHQQECFSDLGYKTGDFPESERAAEEVLAIPVYPELTEDQQAYVVEKISTFYKR